MKNKPKLIVYCVALLILCTAVYVVLSPSDIYDITYDNFYSVPFNDAALETMLADNSVRGAETDYVGVILKTDLFDLKKGDYTITVRYSNTGAENACELYSPSYVSSTNEIEKVFAKQVLDITQAGESAFSVSFDKPAEFLVLRIVYTGGDIHIDSIEVAKTGVYYTDAVFAALIIAFFGSIAIYLYIKDSGKKASPSNGGFKLSRFQTYMLCLLFALIATLPLFRESIVVTHDGYFHLARIEGIAKGLAQGQFPVRINADFAVGKGSAEPIMYPNLFMYLPGIMVLLGSSTMFAYITFCLFTNIATALIAYFCFRRLLRSDYMGIIATVFYMFAMYRIVDLYTRGAFGELFAMSMLPLIILGMYEIVYGDEKKYKYLVFGGCGLLGSHILSVLLCFIFCAVFALCNLKKIFKRPRIFALGKAAGLIILLNLWFLVPFFTYYGIGLKLFDPYYIAEHRVRIPQLFQTFVNAFGPSEYLDSPLEEMSLSVGGVLAVACIVYIVCMWKMRKDKSSGTARLFKIGNYSLAFSLASLVISSTLFPWDFIYNLPVIGRFLTIVQFPWRYLMIATVFMCITAAIAIWYITRNIKRKTVCAVAVVVLCLLALTPYFYDYYSSGLQTAYLDTKYDTRYDSAFPTDYFYPETDPNLLCMTGYNMNSSVSDISYNGYYKEGAYLHFVYSAPYVAEGDYIDVPLYCYPGYKVVYNDAEILKTARGENDVIRIYLPEGATSGSIRVKYTGLWYFRLGDAVTAATIITIAVASIIRRRKNTAKL